MALHLFTVFLLLFASLIKVEATASTIASVGAQVKDRLNRLRSAAAQEVNHTANTIVNRACSNSECSGRGSCLGTADNFVCLCQLGYSGRFCEDAMCDSNRDCNGRGLCIGTVNRLTCLCNLGFTGARCETLIS